MNDRMYRAFLGAFLLVSLIFDLNWLMYGLIAMLMFEGLTNWTLPVLLGKLIPGLFPPRPCAFHQYRVRYQFEAERAWRLLVGTLLLVTYVFKLWFVPWFMAFVILGAGVSGICPAAFSLRRIGFK